MTEHVHPMAKYLRPGAEVTTACPGCGDGTIAHSILRAIDESGCSMDDFVFVCGIGCAGWIPSPYYNADTLHTTHGRPIAFATGVKLAMPDRRVIVVSGDGDLSAIGGNHLIHAARRDIGLTVVCVNNGIYGMTGGQVAPTTPVGVKTATTPHGASVRPVPSGGGCGSILCGPVVVGASPPDYKGGAQGIPALWFLIHRGDEPVSCPIWKMERRGKRRGDAGGPEEEVGGPPAGVRVG